MLEVPLLTEDQCRVVAEATAEAISVPGFVPTFSLFDPSAEVPIQDLPAEVRCSSRSRVAGWDGAVETGASCILCRGFFKEGRKCSGGLSIACIACARSTRCRLQNWWTCSMSLVLDRHTPPPLFVPAAFLTNLPPPEGFRHGVRGDSHTAGALY